MTNVVNTAIIVGYALLVLLVGIVFARRQGSSEMFFLADRTLGTFQVFGTTFSTFLGTGLMFTLASFGYLYGVGAFILPGAAVIGFALFAWTTPHIKALSDQEGAITLPALLAQYWHARTRVLAALVTVSLFAGTLAANLVAAGTVLQAFLEVPLRSGIVAFGGLVVAYTVLGGFSSVMWTDILQMGFIAGVIGLALPGFVLIKGGSRILASLPAGHLDPLSLPVGLLVAYLFIGIFAFFGSQDLFQRVYAARRNGDARRGMLLFTGSLAVMATVAVGLGIGARALRPDIGENQALVALTEAAVPPGFVGIVLLGFLALANSDADSQLLTVTSNVTQDLLPYLGVIDGNQTSVLLDRVAALGIGTVAVLVAIAVPDLTTLFSTLGSWFAILGVVVIATLFWSRMTDTAAFVGLTVGFLAPIAFVVLTGNIQAATMVGVIPAVTAVGVISFVANRSE